jgi:hypothetical protein
MAPKGVIILSLRGTKGTDAEGRTKFA